MKPTALETLQSEQFQSLEAPLDSLEIGQHETTPVSIHALAETATKTALTAFESLASTPPAEGRGTVWFTNRTTLDSDPQSGS